MSTEAASATKHAVEFNHRELLAMRLMLDSRRDDGAAAAHTDDADTAEQLLAAIVASANDPQPQFLNTCNNFRGFQLWCGLCRLVATATCFKNDARTRC
jgi:hypothetical protein